MRFQTRDITILSMVWTLVFTLLFSLGVEAAPKKGKTPTKAKSAKTVKATSKGSKSAKPVASTKVVKSNKSNKSNKPNKEKKPMKAAKADKNSKPARPAKVEKSTKASRPAKVEKPVQTSVKSSPPPEKRAPSNMGGEMNAFTSSGGGERSLEIRGQARTLSMMLVLRSGKENIHFVKPRTDYREEILGTQY